MVKLGIKGRQETTVTTANIATNVGSGKVKVFATPMMISLIEKAAVLSIEPCLEEGQSSVGTHINVSHCAATPHWNEGMGRNRGHRDRPPKGLLLREGVR